jgi:type I restriction enzyme S subunit
VKATVVELSRVIRVHYGAALKEAARVQSGAHDVFGSSGVVGRHSESLFEYPSIVIGRKGSVGSVTYAPNGGWAIDTAFFVERLEPSGCDLRYLFHALKNARLAQHTITTSIPGLSRDDVYRTRIPLPRVDEQQRIADILDKADAVRRKREETIALTEEVLRSAFLEMFGDPVTNPKGLAEVPFGNLVEFRTGKLDSNAAVPGGKYPFFTCSRETSEIDAFAFDCEALLLAGNNATADYSVKRYAGRFNAYQRTYVITLRSRRNSYAYLQQALQLKLQELKRSSKGTNTKYLTLGILEPLRILVPTPEAQIAYERVDARIAGARTTQRQALADSVELFNSLTSRAFSGALEVPC